MASIYKRTYRDKKTGKVKKCKKYTIELRDGTRVEGYTDKLATEQKAAALEKSVERGEQGLLDPYADHKKLPLSQHVTDYMAELTAKGRDDKYIANIPIRINRLMDDCGWSTLPDITADAFCKWRESSPLCGGNRGEKGEAAGGKTLNHHLETWRAFCNWCVKRGRMATNPLALVDKVAERVVRQWRALSVEEGRSLLKAVPADRRIVYLTAMSTGLRRTELADLQWGDVRLDSPAPSLKLREDATKARRADTLAIKPELADELRKVRPEDVEETAKVFPRVPSIDVFRSDLRRAGIPWVVPGRGQAVMHSLRKTTATMLQAAGVDRRTAMGQMRLTDTRLLDHVYTDASLLPMTDAVAKLPTLLPSPDAAELAVTVTEGALKKRAVRLAGRLAGKVTREGVGLPATVHKAMKAGCWKTPDFSGNNQHPAFIVRFCHGRLSTAAGGNRTHTPVTGQRILSP